MRIATCILSAATCLAIFSAGCAGPEQKLGRGVRNMTEFARMGEMRRSIEQAGLWDGPDVAYTTGVVKGLNRSVARTFVGLYEVVTCPFPSYDPLFVNTLPAIPVYPDSYKPGLLADPTFGSDTALGFSGGDVFPFVPGSRFKIFND